MKIFGAFLYAVVMASSALAQANDLTFQPNTEYPIISDGNFISQFEDKLKIPEGWSTIPDIPKDFDPSNVVAFPGWKAGIRDEILKLFPPKGPRSNGWSLMNCDNTSIALAMGCAPPKPKKCPPPKGCADPMCTTVTTGPGGCVIVNCSTCEPKDPKPKDPKPKDPKSKD